MGQIVSEALIERLADWGVDTVFGLPGDGINGIMEGLRRQPGQDPVRARPPRGGRRFHGHRARQGHRPARRVPGHLGARRHPPAERPVRRQARPHAGAGHHRHAGDLGPRHRVPAGSRDGQAVPGRRRVRPDDLQPGTAAGGGGPGHTHRLRAPHRRRTSPCPTTSRWPTPTPTRGSTWRRPARRTPRRSCFPRPDARTTRTCSGSPTC